jgi:glycosyltransferase involved in cell wall biosynthesis
MKVLFIQKRGNKAGAQVCLNKTVKALKNHNIIVKVIMGENGWLTNSLREMEALGGIAAFPSFRSFFSKSFKLLPLYQNVKKAWNTYGPFQIIHANDIWDALLAEWLARKWKTPWIVHLRTLIHESHFKKYHCHKANAVIAVSPLVYDLAKDWPHQLLEYNPDGLTEDDFSPLSNKDCQFPQEIGVIGHSGEIKGWDDVPPALGKVKERGGILPVKIVFWGAIERKSQNRLQQRMPVGIELIFQGHVDNLTEHVRKVDLVLVPSRKESFGMARIETIAGGVPLLTSRTGIAPYIMGEDSPWTFSPGDPDSLAEAWLCLPSVWPERQEAVIRWQQKLREEFMMDKTTEKLIKVYNKILN